MQKCHLLIVVANSLSSDQALQNGVCMHRSRLDPPTTPRLTDNFIMLQKTATYYIFLLL